MSYIFTLSWPDPGYLAPITLVNSVPSQVLYLWLKTPHLIHKGMLASEQHVSHYFRKYGQLYTGRFNLPGYLGLKIIWSTPVLQKKKKLYGLICA